MATQAEIATALIGDYCGDLRRAGFFREDLLSAMKNGVAAMEQIDDAGEAAFIESLLGDIPNVQVFTAGVEFDSHGRPQCSCPVCKAKREARNEPN